jgi:hypothetical protein
VSRPLLENEKILLLWLLQNGPIRAQSYIPQVEWVVVTGECNCGCPTIDLQINGTPINDESKHRVLVDGEGKSPEGIQIGLIVFVDGGRLTSLELYNYGDSARFSLPLLSDVKVI